MIIRWLIVRQIMIMRWYIVRQIMRWLIVRQIIDHKMVDGKFISISLNLTSINHSFHLQQKQTKKWKWDQLYNLISVSRSTISSHPLSYLTINNLICLTIYHLISHLIILLVHISNNSYLDIWDMRWKVDLIYHLPSHFPSHLPSHLLSHLPSHLLSHIPSHHLPSPWITSIIENISKNKR